MTPRHTPRSLPRSQRGMVARGVMVLAMLVGGVVLQSTTPAWQSRLDAAAAFVGVPYARCDKPATTNASRPQSTPATQAAGWNAGHPSMVAGGAAGSAPGAATTAVLAPAI